MNLKNTYQDGPKTQNMNLKNVISTSYHFKLSFSKWEEEIHQNRDKKKEESKELKNKVSV